MVESIWDILEKKSSDVEQVEVSAWRFSSICFNLNFCEAFSFNNDIVRQAGSYKISPKQFLYLAATRDKLFKYSLENL